MTWTFARRTGSAEARAFVNIGERTNVTGSAKFKKLILAGDYDAAVEVARDQVENGAQIIDVNMDEALLDSEQAMTTFLKRIAAEPDIARVPVMIDSSKWSVIEAGLKCVSGKPIVNSISLKEGEGPFLELAAQVPRLWRRGRRHGVRRGRARPTPPQRKVEICERAYKLLVADGTDPQDIIFDPNIFAVATGIDEHRRYALDFIEAAREIRARCPGVAHLRRPVEPQLLVPRQRAGAPRDAQRVPLSRDSRPAWTWASSTPASSTSMTRSTPSCARPARTSSSTARDDATERLVDARRALPRHRRGRGEEARPNGARCRSASGCPTRWSRASTPHIVEDTEEARQAVRPADRGDRRPADGRHERRRRPVRIGQDVPAAGGQVGARDEAAVAHLIPFIEAEKEKTGATKGKGRIVMATVKGDVHDIGKNIVGVVLQCNGFEVIDLGVMVPWQDILKAANDNKADMIGLSGLITPSLDEMVTVAGEMQRLGLETAAADRRRDDQQGAYGAADRPGLRRAGDPCARRQPRGRRRLVAGVGHAARAADRQHRRRL